MLSTNRASLVRSVSLDPVSRLPATADSAWVDELLDSFEVARALLRR